MTDQPEKLDLRSLDLTEEKKQELLRLFPEIRTEGEKIDFERLKLALGEAVDVGKERYGMNWPGKADCFRTIQAPSTGTLLPCPEESVNFDTTENLIIEGDNLEVLKLLQKSYLGKVKMIYIDPPYNTGNDFIYPDNYTESLQTYLEYTGQVDSEGRKFGTNSESDGRFHSRWMNMMYPRLYLARNLLRDDGVIFISIDDTEFDNLKKICNEVFGEGNLLACIANINNPKGRSDDKYFATAHEYLLVYCKSTVILRGWEPDNRIIKRYNKKDLHGRIYREIDLRKTGDNDRRSDRQNLFYYFLYNPTTSELIPTRDEGIPNGFIQIKPLREDGVEGNWRWELDTVREKIDSLMAKFMPVRRNWSVFEKDYLLPDERIKPTTAWTLKEVNSERGTEQFMSLDFAKEIFPRPKPIGFIRQMLELSTYQEQGDIILDFFAGSGSTAHAILNLNNKDCGNRKFILIQLPETCEKSSEAFKAGYATIFDITKERVRRVIKNLNDANAEQLPLHISQDVGFRVYKLAESNFKPWDAQAPTEAASLARQLELHIEHIRAGRSPQDILYEILLKSGFPLTTPVETLTLAGKQVFSVAGGALLICLEPQLTMEVIRALAAQKPERVVCLDAGFAGNDPLKANAVQIFKTQAIPSFKTV
ncbi:MAG: site-specific DNA-methyltransferase [Bellilinea sp.]